MPVSKKKISKARQMELVDQFCVIGVPESALDAFCKEAKINRKKLEKFLFGQTMGLVGTMPLIYPWDIKRFIQGLPVID